MADISEKQIYEAFGLGENVQEPADPATNVSEGSPEAGANVQEIADPAPDTAQTAEGADTASTAETAAPEQNPEEETDTGAEADKQPLTPEQRRENAARRRQQEATRQQAAIDQAVETALKQEREKNATAMQEFFSKAGLKNTVTGQLITSMDEFDSWYAQFGASKLENELKSGKLTPEGLAAAIGNHPAVKQAQQLVAQNTAQEQAKKAADARAKIEAELAEIRKTDASIHTLEDLFRAPYGKELYDMTQRGYSIKDAHYLLNRERLEQARLEAARQQSVSNARGKDHMTGTTTPRGGGTVSVPKADLAMFREFNPNATDAEIQAYYNNYLKR